MLAHRDISIDCLVIISEARRFIYDFFFTINSDK